MTCTACLAALDEALLYARCTVCVTALCVSCARTHFCTPRCPARGCHAGLCTKLVRDGALADEYGIP